jgi:hypothetical protein
MQTQPTAAPIVEAAHTAQHHRCCLLGRTLKHTVYCLSSMFERLRKLRTTPVVQIV